MLIHSPWASLEPYPVTTLPECHQGPPVFVGVALDDINPRQAVPCAVGFVDLLQIAMPIPGHVHDAGVEADESEAHLNIVDVVSGAKLCADHLWALLLPYRICHRLALLLVV